MANPPNWMCNASLSLPLNDNPDDPYDTLAAKSRMLDAAGVGTDNPNHMKAVRGFLVSDMANPGTPSAYKLGFADVQNGMLVAHQKGLQTCAMNLAKSDLPSDLMAQAKAVLAHYTGKVASSTMNTTTSRTKANPSKWTVKAARDLPIAMTDSWDGPAAQNRMLDAAGIGGDSPDYAKACRGFLVCDTANSDLRGSYKLPFADIIGGTLKADSSGLSAAAQRLPQTDIPDDVRTSAQNVIDAYKAKIKPPPKAMQRAYSVFTVKAVDSNSRTFEGVATTPTPDRTGDIVEPQGAQFQLPIPLLWQHDSSQPIGWIRDAIVSSNGITVQGEVASVQEAGALRDRLDEAWQTIKAGLVGGLSIGFKPLEEARISDTFAYRIQKWLWLELSAVTIPANAEASITAIKTIGTRELAAIGRRNNHIVRLSASTSPGDAGFTRKPVVKDKVTDMKTISEQITALESTRAAKSAQMEAVMTRSIEEGRSTDAAEQEEFDTLEQDIQAIDGDLRRFRSLEKSAAFSARDVTPNVRTIEGGANLRSSVVVRTERPRLEKGCEFARFAICLAAGRGNLPQSLEIAKSRFGESDDLVALMKNAVNAGTTTDPNWAGNLVPLYIRYTGDFVEFLRPQTILGKFGVGGIPALRRIPFNISIAGQTSGGAGYWVGDGQPKPLTRFDASLVNLRWAKVANIAVITEELLRFAEPAADVLVRDMLAAALIERLDIDFVDPNKAAVVNVSPASVTFGVSAITSSGNSAQDVRTDIAASLTQFIAANISPTAAVWILSARRALSLSLMRNALGQREFPDITMMGGMLEGIPVITSEYQHSDSDGDNAVLVNASDIWLADDGQVMLDASREASLQMNDVPTMDASQGTGTSLVSMFQTNSVALRAERWINWQKRRPQAVVVLNAVNWGLDSGT